MAHQTGNSVCVAAMGSVLQWAFIHLDITQCSTPPLQLVCPSPGISRGASQLVLSNPRTPSGSSSCLEDSQDAISSSGSSLVLLSGSDSCTGNLEPDEFLAAWRKSRKQKRTLSQCSPTSSEASTIHNKRAR